MIFYFILFKIRWENNNSRVYHGEIKPLFPRLIPNCFVTYSKLSLLKISSTHCSAVVLCLTIMREIYHDNCTN